MTPDQPNHEKELNKVWKIMSAVLPSRSEVFGYKGGGGSSLSLLFPSIFSPKIIAYQAANSDTLPCDAIKKP